MSSKTFTLEDSSINIKGIKCSASSPISSAKKIAKQLFELAKSGQHKRVRKITFNIKTPSKKTYTYTASKIKSDKKDYYNIIVKPQKTPLKKRRGGKFVEDKFILKEFKNYILITDIGRDSDDTLALLILLYLHKKHLLNLLAVAVSGAKLEMRANCVYYWLQMFDITDIPVIFSKEEELQFDPIDIDERSNVIIKDIDSNVCILPYNNNDTNAVKALEKFKQTIKQYTNLYEVFENYNGSPDSIDILGIAPIRPLERALKLASQNEKDIMQYINNIFFQGNVYVDQDKLIADIRAGGRGAYNFGNGFPNSTVIQEETQYVIDLFTESKKDKQDNKLYFVGKNTAYLVELTMDDLLNKIDKNIGILTIKKTLLFAKNLPNVFNNVFAHNIMKTEKTSMLDKHKSKILEQVSNNDSKLNQHVKDLEDRILYLTKNDNLYAKKIEYLNKELNVRKEYIKDITQNNEKYYDSCYNVFIEYLVDINDINNLYTSDFLQTINKITNPYDLVLVYLALYGEEFFDYKKSVLLTEEGKEYQKSKNLHFNEKNSSIFRMKDDIDIKTHMIQLLETALKSINTTLEKLSSSEISGGKHKQKISRKSSQKPSPKISPKKTNKPKK